MANMKRFAVWLASLVYQWECTDEEIVKKFSQREDAKQLKDVETWLKEQIQTVRKNPGQYREMMSWQRGKDY